MAIWQSKKKTPIKALEQLPPEAIFLSDGRIFVPLKPSSEPRPNLPAQNGNAIPVAEFYGVDNPYPHGKVDPVPMPRDAPKPKFGNPQVTPHPDLDAKALERMREASMPSEAPAIHYQIEGQ